MAYRANLFDFGAIAGENGGANASANDAAFSAAIASPVKLIEIDPEIFEISQPILHSAHGKTFQGIPGHDLFGSFGYGTRIKWCGAAGGTMVKVEPLPNTGDLMGAGFCGVELQGNGLAAMGLAVNSQRQARLNDIHVLGLQTTSSAIGVLFRSIGANGDVSCSLGMEVNRMSINVDGDAHGLMLDGFVSGSNRNSCFGHFQQTRIVHKNGVAIYLRGCDDNNFFSTSTARVAGGTGYGLLLDGLTEDCMGNIFCGLHIGSHPVGATTKILSRGTKARLNAIYGLNGVDNVPVVSITDGSELYYDYVGGGYTPTLAGEKALSRMPKRQELTY